MGERFGDGTKGETSRRRREWDAEVELSIEEAGELIAEAFPDLDAVALEPFGEGFDNRAFRVGDHIFRFPRREFGGSAMEVEIRWLPTLARHLPLEVPVAERVGEANARFPWRWAGYRVIEGVTADRAAMSEEERARWAVPLAEFLRSLHAVPVPDDAPGDELGRAEHRRRAPRVIERFGELEDPGLRARAIAAVEESAQAPEWDGQRVWVHGDLYGRHLIAGRPASAGGGGGAGAGELVGVIDWGDLHAGDRAIDLSIAWSWLPAAARGEFRAAYGEISGAEWERARFRALHYAACLPPYGRAVDDRPIQALGRLALTNSLSPP